MISHVSEYSLARGEKSSISNTFCHAKREYSFLVRPIGCAPVFYMFVVRCSSILHILVLTSAMFLRRFR